MTSTLVTRIDHLISHLKDAHDPDTWWVHLELEGSQEGLSIELWRRVLNNIWTEAEEFIETLEDARDGLVARQRGERDTWRLYGEVLRKSEHIFRECLELLGGLALRARIADPDIGAVYRLADSLIQEAAVNLATSASFAIPATEETLSSTMRRVARVRFPEWTLWTLPLVAYEYAYVAFEEPSLRRMPKRFAATSDPPGVGELSHEARDDAELRVRVLLADALAVYTLGPAYACSALVLRLQPFENGSATRPSDLDRAEMILGVLRSTGAGSEPEPAFADVHDALRDRWDRTTNTDDDDPDGPPAPRGVGPPREPLLDPQDVVARFNKALVGKDKAFGSQAWARAVDDSDRWWAAIRKRQDLGEPIVDGQVHQLRDLLNAVWRTRLGILGAGDALALEGSLPETVDEDAITERLADVGTRACLEIAAGTRRPLRVATPGQRASILPSKGASAR